MKIGLVLEGGGGKGSYQIGAWKAIRELGIEKYITCVAGTSVGALNAALFYKGDYNAAEKIWRSITNDDILFEKDTDFFDKSDGYFSQKKLGDMISTIIVGTQKSKTCNTCYVTCRCRDQAEYKYFKWSDVIDTEYKKLILLASSAIPVVFPSVKIDEKWFVDGGVNADNTPITPIEREKPDYIVVIHLSSKEEKISSVRNNVYHIVPSHHLGGLITGTLNFNQESVSWRINLGYKDTMELLQPLAIECEMEERNGSLSVIKNNLKSNVIKRDIAKISISKLSISKKKTIVEEIEMKDFTFSNEEAKKLYEEKYARIQKIAEDDTVDEAFLWDKTVAKYAQKMTKVKKILESEGINELITSKMKTDMDNFIGRCREAEFHIALVGAIKAGKSTLINAVLGYEYASTKVTPETASLTKFRKSKENQVKVTFYSVEDWNRLWKSAQEAKASVFLEEYANLHAESEKDRWLGKQPEIISCISKEQLVEEIQKWTSSKSAHHYFVKEVEVGLAEFELPDGVVLVDTPGLDDIVEYRSNITRDYIDRANAVMVCVKSDALTGEEMKTIYNVFSHTRYNPEKVYVIATQVDTLNRPRENWAEQRVEWIKHLKEGSAFDSRDLAERNLIPVSAYLYTLLKQYGNLAEDDDKRWELETLVRKFKVRESEINEKYNELIDFTNIDLLKIKIQTEIVQNYKSILIQDIEGSYNMCKDSILETVANIEKTQREIIEANKSGIEEIKKKQAEYERKFNEHEQDRKDLEKLLGQLKIVTTQRAEELEKAIKSLA